MTKTAKLLRPEEAQAYAGILRAAFAQAQAFDGSEALIQSLTDAFNAADVFVRRKVGFTGHDALADLEEFERDFADEAGFPKDSIGQMFQQCVRDFYRNMAGPGDIYERLRAGGAVVIETDSVFVKTKGGKILAAGENPKPFQIKTDPRLAWLIEDLQAIGIYTDDLIVRRGKVRDNMVRQEPYIVIDIPHLNKQIALCEQVGEITFVSSEIFDPALYENADKDILEGIPQITPAECYNRDYWRREIRCILEGDGTQTRRKVNVRDIAANPPVRSFPLTVDLIDAMALAYNVENPGKWPTNKTSPRWQTIHSAIVNRSCGLGKLDIPKHVKGIGSYLEWRGFKISHMSSTKHLTLEILDSKIRDYNAKNPGLWPSQSTNKEFRKLSSAIRKRLLGLDKLDIPKNVKGLGSYLEWRGFKVSFKSASKHLSIDILDCMILDYNAKNSGQWPTQNTSKEWRVIHSAIEKRIRSLSKAPLTEDVKGLVSYIKWRQSNGFLRDNSFILDKIHPENEPPSPQPGV